jgi:DNA-binding IclR family transcriptional regulator
MSESLKKGIDALLFLSSKKSAGVTEIAQALNVNKSTAFRIMRTYLAFNMVEQVKETGKYRLGPATLKLSQQYYGNLCAVTAAKPVMSKLCEVTGESAHLCIYSNDSAVVIEQVIANSRPAANAKIGNVEPLHCSAVGKCLLAFSDPERQSQMIAQIKFEKYTPNTITDKDALNAQLTEILKKGYAVDLGELSPEIRCVAAPVFNNRGECNYSMGISGAASRMTDEVIASIGTLLVKAASSVSAELGFAKP